jgi:hypothetical protein
LYQTLSEVSDLPVRGFVEIEAGTWRDVGKLLPADPATVRRAAREAELLVLKGSPGEIAAGASARGTWLWPSGAGGEAQLAGDWYAAGRAGSPLSDAFVGLPVDSFPPLGPLTPIEPGDDEWIGLTAQLGRRGAERPVITGRERAGARRVFTAGEGLWRWRFRGGASEASYRALVASAVSWLVQTPGGRTVARPVDAVVAADQQVVFAWIGPGAPRAVPVEFRTADSVASDTLRFDGEGRAEVHLSPGVHRYQVEGGGGTLIVEEWSREFLPAPVALTAREAPTGIGTHPVSGREWLPLFAACILLFGLEWALRRHLGLR